MRVKSFDYDCPAMHCNYTADNWEQLRGHVNGNRPHCSYHEQLPPMKKHEFLSDNRKI
jgi:hypothetical protein